ncbi:3-isopropylmalate dehydrogenase [Patescibacteria group bacterium]|nr:3-isopropylmalate dehydrogenase [Patescibacteria group bacterium]MCL5798182.1 3-isopropylmalate dehydrogenase [Patescibacteria group bacterium]
MKKKIALLAGDGVGPEVTWEAVKVLKKVGEKFNHQFIFQEGLIGSIAIDKTGGPLPSETLKLCKSSDAVLFGAIGDPKYDNNPEAKIRPEQGLLKLRKSLELFANIRPIILFKNLSEISPLKKERVEGVDMVVVRELTGGIYFGQPRLRKNKGNIAVDTSIYSKEEVINIANVAFNLAQKRQKRVTSVDKANVLETSRLWRETVEKVARSFPSVILNHMFVDNAAMQIIKNPAQFDVILTENMFGDILTDEASVISGSIGLLPSASIGKKYSLFEPIHGAYNKAAGKNTANPLATILSIVMMLRISFRMGDEAKIVEKAIEKFIKSGYRTPDIKDKNTPENKILGTKETGDKIVSYI